MFDLRRRFGSRDAVGADRGDGSANRSDPQLSGILKRAKARLGAGP